MSRRRRWSIAAGVALAVHGVVAVRVLSGRPLPTHSFVKGAPAPAYLHMSVVESAHVGALVARAKIPLAPKTRVEGEEQPGEPEHPRLGLWVLEAPVRSQPRVLFAALEHHDDDDDDDDDDAGPGRE